MKPFAVIPILFAISLMLSFVLLYVKGAKVSMEFAVIPLALILLAIIQLFELRKRRRQKDFGKSTFSKQSREPISGKTVAGLRVTAQS